MAAVVGNTLMKSFPEVLRVISDGIASISSLILSFKSSRVRGRCRKTLSFRYPHRKKSQGLKSGDLAGHQMGSENDREIVIIIDRENGHDR